MKTLDLGKVAIVPRGDYASETRYKPLDIVTHEGSAYLVLKDCTGVTPVTGEYYQLLSQRGPQGEKGEKGDTGPQGATGATGPKGATGASGANATINGYNTLKLSVGNDLDSSRSGSTLKISTHFIWERWITGCLASTTKTEQTYRGLPIFEILLHSNGYLFLIPYKDWSDDKSSVVLKDLCGSSMKCTVTMDPTNYKLTHIFSSTPGAGTMYRLLLRVNS